MAIVCGVRFTERNRVKGKIMNGSMVDVTIDGYPVEVGMTVWDYDLRRAVVGEPQGNGHPAEATWYAMATPEGGRSREMDAKRMWRRHPSTGELA